MVVPGKKLGGNTGCRDVHHHQQEASYKSGKTKKRQKYLLLSFFGNNIWPTFSTFCINSIISDICFCIKDNAHNLNVRTPSLGGEPQWPFGVFPKIHQNLLIRSSLSNPVAPLVTSSVSSGSSGSNKVFICGALGEGADWDTSISDGISKFLCDWIRKSSGQSPPLPARGRIYCVANVGENINCCYLRLHSAAPAPQLTAAQRPLFALEIEHNHRKNL